MEFQSKFSISRALLFGIGVIAGVFAGLLSSVPCEAASANAFGVVVSAFSIFAGVLVVALSAIGDPADLGPGAKPSQYRWQQKAVAGRRGWYLFLFQAYMLTIVLIFAEALVRSSHESLAILMRRLIVGFGTCAFIWSIGLPSAVTSIHRERSKKLLKRAENAQREKEAAVRS